MALRSLGTLTLDLVAKVGGFTGPLEKASRTAKREMTNIAGSVKSAATAITAAGAAATTAAAGVIAFTNAAAQNAKEMQNQASLANASVEEFQRWSYATQSVGVEQDKLADILKDTNDRVGDFLTTGGGEMADFFEKIAPKIGVTAEEFRNLSGPQALQKFYNGLEEANLSQAEMVFYMESVADEATALIPLLRDGGAEFARMAEEADNLGIVLTSLDIAKLNEFAAQFDRISTILQSMGNIVAAELSPYLSVLGDRLVEVTDNADDFRVTISTGMREAVTWVGELLDVWHKLEIATATFNERLSASNVAVAEFARDGWNALAPFLDNFINKINVIIDGLQAIGMDVENIGSFSDSEFLAGFDTQLDEMRQKQWDMAWELHELLQQPLPSEAIDQYLDDVDKKIAEFREKINEEGGLLGSGAGIASSGEAAGSLGSQGEEGTGAAAFWMDEAKLEEQLGYWERWLEGASEAVTSFDELAGNTIENFSRRFGDAFESMIFDSKSLGDAIYDLADGMLRSVVNALGEMAAQWLAYQAVQMVVGRTTQATAASAQTANAMAMTQMAALNAFASTAAIPIVGPAMAPAAAAAALAATMPYATAVSALSMAGMAHDGIDNVPTEGTWLLDKGERVLTNPQASKLDAFLAQQQGGGGGEAPVINIIEDKSRAGTTSQRQEQDGRWVIDVVVASISGDGQIDKAMRNKYGLTPQGR